MYANELIGILKLFNEKAEKLGSLPFTSDLPGSGLTIKASKGNPVQAIRRGPQGQSIDAFILTLRFFIQNNETISLENLERNYESSTVPEEIKQQFLESHQNLNDYLDQPSPINHNNRQFSNRDILEIVVYGGYAHANPEKKRTFDTLMNFGPMSGVLTNEFVSIVGNLLNFILYIKELNLKVLGNLENS